MSEPGWDQLPRHPLPAKLRREQQGLGLILSLISRSLAICVIAVALYLAYQTW